MISHNPLFNMLIVVTVKMVFISMKVVMVRNSCITSKISCFDRYLPCLQINCSIYWKIVSKLHFLCLIPSILCSTVNSYVSLLSAFRSYSDDSCWTFSSLGSFNMQKCYILLLWANDVWKSELSLEFSKCQLPAVPAVWLELWVGRRYLEETSLNLTMLKWKFFRIEPHILFKVHTFIKLDCANVKYFLK